ncbi:MAG: hypothetical protein ABEJ26_10715 [Halosimplex sp.]
MYGDLVPDDRRTQLHRVATDLAFCSERLDRAAFRRPDASPSIPNDLHESERAVLDPLLADGFELVGAGSARCVLGFPSDSPLSDHVVKLPRFGVSPPSSGVVQNKREALIWGRHGRGGDWPLVPVADYEPERFSWLVMPRGDPLAERPEVERDERLRRVRSRVRFLEPFDMRELFAANVVLVDGEPLLADYGLPEGL